jgi:mRNA interferase MazF
MKFQAGDVVTVDFPGVMGIKRRPAVVLSSALYHTNRPDVILGLITTRTDRLGLTDYALADWQAAKLRVASVFRCFIVTLPPEANLARVGHLSERDWQGVKGCFQTAFGDLLEK